jgi:hypothetical protein
VWKPVKIKSQLFALLFSSLLLPALTFGQTVITYTTTGVLQTVTGADKLGLNGTTITVTNSLTEGQTPISGTTNQYTTSVTATDTALPGGGLSNVTAVVTINYSGVNSPTNSIVVAGSKLIFTVNGTVYVPSVSGVSPEPIAATNLTSQDTFTVGDTLSGDSTTYTFSSGSISSVPALACQYTVTPQTIDFPVAGGVQTVTVTTGTTCQWSAVANNPWITVTPATFTGPGTATITVGANSTGAEQIGTATIAGLAVNVTQDGPVVCTFTVAPLALAFPSTGGPAQGINVTASAPTCVWTAASTLGWLTLSETGGTGSGTVLATALPNAGNTNLMGNITVAGQTVAVSEAATNACSFSVAPSSLLFISNGGSSTLTLSASSPTCQWTASFVGGPSWISVSPSSGTGSATVTVTAVGNGSGSVQNATLDIAGQVVNVQQSNNNACTFTATSNPSPLDFVSSSAIGYITVTASSQTCPWTISTIPEWLVPENNLYTGTGTFTVTLTAFPNTSTSPRTATVTIAGITFLNVTQNGTNPVCNYTVSQNALQFTNTGGIAPITLGVSSTTCAWTAVSSEPWVTVSPASGTGPPVSPLTVVAQGNTTGQTLTATVTIGGLPISVTQSSCTFTLPTNFSLSFPSQGGTLPIPVTASTSSCDWSATSSVPWLTFLPTGIAGSGTILAIANTNLTSAIESGTATIAGQAVPVTVASSGTCTFTVNNSAVLFPSTGGSTVASVIANGVGCAWTASAPSWVTLSETGGTGSSSVLMTVPSDATGPTLSGNVIIAGTSIPVSQTGACTFTVSPTSIAVDVNGLLQPISINASAPTCQWTAIAPIFAPLLTATSGTGSGSTTLTIPFNSTGVDLYGTLTVAGQAIPVVQDFTQQVFEDVPPGTFYFDAVNLLDQKGITSGCGPTTFCPDDNLTRAQMAIFMVKAAYNDGPFTTNPVPYFNDVPVGSFGFQWIQKMYELGLTSGCGNGDFCPNDSVTRDEAAVFLIKARYGPSTIFDYPPTPYFNDVPATYWAFPWIQRMAEDQITSGCGGGDYCPLSDLTRGEMAVFIMRAIYNDFAPIGSSQIVSVVPNVLVAGTNSVVITGINTSFVQGQTLVSAIPGVTISDVSVSGPTTLTATMTVLSNATAQPYSVYVITGSQEEVLPFGLTIP